ncbi:MAG: ferredoxin [Clostridium sp.]|nr:ferredoxin [Clostridium sp.]
MKAHVDKDTCIACGLCPSISPECFEIEDDGKAGCIVDVIPENCEDEAQEAADSCPVNAISTES